MKDCFMKIYLALACAVCSLTATAQTQFGGNYPNNRLPLAQKEYIALPLGNIRAEGWLKEQLIRMKDGLTGHLDQVYEPVMGKRNGWLGGDGDVWERGPYWIDGLLPLAYILDDKELIAKVQPWIEWTLKSQKENGFFGPDTDRPNEPGLQRDNAKDWWPRMVVLKVMQQYYMATRDERVITFLTKYFRYQFDELPKTPLGKWTYWGEQRGGDNLMVVYWLYNHTGDKFLLDLAELIHRQTFNWTGVFTEIGWLNRPLSLHCVNLGQGFKEPAIYYQQSKNPEHLKALDKGVEQMRHTIGLPTGLWGGDELLRFGSPVAGSELCTAVEMMFSLESILEITGNAKWGDYLERVAYNALPTQITDDFSARQYYQQFNQVNITREWREFSTPHDDTDILFGTLTGYPCCTSNLHQGWPKLVQNLWYATAGQGIAALVYAPSTVNALVADSIPVTITEKTGYPFRENIEFTFKFDDKKQKKSLFPIPFPHTRLVQVTNYKTQRKRHSIRRCGRGNSTYHKNMERRRHLVRNIPYGSNSKPVVRRRGVRGARALALCPENGREMEQERNKARTTCNIRHMVLRSDIRHAVELRHAREHPQRRMGKRAHNSNDQRLGQQQIPLEHRTGPGKPHT